MQEGLKPLQQHPTVHVHYLVIFKESGVFLFRLSSLIPRVKPWPGDAGGPGADHQGSGDEAVVFRPAEE